MSHDKSKCTQQSYQFYDLSYQMSFGQVDFYPCCAPKIPPAIKSLNNSHLFLKKPTVLRFFCKAISLFCVKNTHGDFIKEKNINAFLKYTTNNAMFPNKSPPPNLCLPSKSFYTNFLYKRHLLP